MGKIPGGDAVAGMTKEQVKLAMGSPATFDKINGEDVWIYVGERPSETNSLYSPPSSMDSHRSFTETSDFAAFYTKVRTAIHFKGDRAVYAQITEARP